MGLAVALETLGVIRDAETWTVGELVETRFTDSGMRYEFKERGRGGASPASP